MNTQDMHASKHHCMPHITLIISAETNLPNIRMFVWPQVRSNSSFDLEYSKCQYGAFAGHNAWFSRARFLKLPVNSKRGAAPRQYYGMHARAAWTCMRTPAGRGMHSCNKVRPKHNRAHGWCCCSLELGIDMSTTLQLLSILPQDHESPQSSVLLRNCSTRTWTHAPFERWIGENRAEPLPLVRSIRPFGITFGVGQNKTLVYNGSTTSNLMSPPSTDRKHPSKVVGPTVVTQEPGLQLPPAAPAAAPVSLSLPVSQCCSLSAVFLLDSV